MVYQKAFSIKTQHLAETNSFRIRIAESKRVFVLIILWTRQTIILFQFVNNSDTSIAEENSRILFN